MTLPMIEPGALELRSVTIAMRGRPVTLIKDLDVTVAPGSVTTIMGPSGSGKSTLLAYVGGFMDRSAFEGHGSVIIDGDAVDGKPAEERRLGVLFQEGILFPHLSVGSNLLFGLPRDPFRSRSERREVAAMALKEAGLEGFMDRDPATLSGGQKARVALLRTLLSEPRALLLDEPFGKLDAELREEFRAFVFAHAAKRQLPVLLVTHDSADARAANGPLLQL